MESADPGPVVTWRRWSRWVALIGTGAIVLPGVTGCGADPPDAPTITALADYSISLSATPVHIGTNVFVIQNGGSQEHELVVFKIDQPVADLARTPDGNLDEEVLTSVSDGDNLQPGTDQTRLVNLTEPGSYLFVCNLPGHFARGMYTVVTPP
jgi:uncharacterized cupredoxin-like copper-binding protein